MCAGLAPPRQRCLTHASVETTQEAATGSRAACAAPLFPPGLLHHSNARILRVARPGRLGNQTQFFCRERADALRAARTRRVIRMMMRSDMVYRYPIWAVGFSLVVVALVGTGLLELVIRRFVSPDVRRQHNEIAAAIFSIIGVTYAVLLAFVAMLAWQNFNKAKAASYLEAGQIMDVFEAANGLAESTRTKLIGDLNRYTVAVVATEWPAQADGHVVRDGDKYLAELDQLAADLRPASQTETSLHMLLLQSLTRLRDARQERLLAAETTIPEIVWFVVIIGGVITIAFGSFFGSPSVRMHLAMCSLLALSGVLVLVLIIALSNPFRGDFRVSTAPFDYALSRIEMPR